jgi:hypothetical protein
VQTAIKLEHTKGSRKMNLEQEIRAILFDIGKEIKLLKIDDDNIVIDIDYERYVDRLRQLLESSTYDQQ